MQSQEKVCIRIAINAYIGGYERPASSSPTHPPMSRAASNAIKILHRQQHALCLSPQNIVEFWNVCTRPVDVNGLGLSIGGTDRYVRKLKRIFMVMQDSLQTFEAWRQLVVQHSVTGAKVHDARLIAIMQAHAVNTILTFNVRDFARYENITPLDPRTVC